MMKKDRGEPERVVTLFQLNAGVTYKVVKLWNLFQPRVGTILDQAEARCLMHEGISVEVV